MNNRNFAFFLHFYQPDRRDPLTGLIDPQPSAITHQNWNERIAYECYGPNAAVEYYDGRRIQKVCNYEYSNFDFGPTLLNWLLGAKPEIYQSIIEADKEGRLRFNGHGPALALASYNHVILPLQNQPDRFTQIYWSIMDFKHHFNRDPEGVWLPEAAVNIDVLEDLAALGIKFTILPQKLAVRFRRLGEKDWHVLDWHGIDTRRAYACKLPSGNNISIFFYDGNISQAAAFSSLLDNADNLMNEMCRVFNGQSFNQLSHFAIDGETLGHHRKFTEKCLAYAAKGIEKYGLGRVTVYGEYLEENPPQYEVMIKDGSWSCGCNDFGRWHRDCGCRIPDDSHSGWNQAWRRPLRDALDWLGNRIDREYYHATKSYFPDPQSARNRYIEVMIDRGKKNNFFTDNAKKILSSEEKTKLEMLLEMQRFKMLSYTSCGWFFNDPTDLSTVQNIKCAKRALGLLRDASGIDLSEEFSERLRAVKSNIGFVDGCYILERSERWDPIMLQI